eukprot:CAMPEP_0183368456 /NCGR_PEP_ID=MMETSP0164_2-20130417/96039_1 /TAXON_ID=221442 /ORGANISM="Coccolithus pelagicus ssp braarudi, Strain PLY182g" /LENGTH=166 /DNA_ID=CAMNT_0025544555 /DNA_START=75 /DNA_END=576 /DNA_ORIENTATION=+
MWGKAPRTAVGSFGYACLPATTLSREANTFIERPCCCTLVWLDLGYADRYLFGDCVATQRGDAEKMSNCEYAAADLLEVHVRSQERSASGERGMPRGTCVAEAKLDLHSEGEGHTADALPQRAISARLCQCVPRAAPAAAEERCWRELAARMQVHPPAARRLDALQ